MTDAQTAGTQNLQVHVRRLLGPGTGQPGILDRHGRVLLSGWDTVRPSTFMVLGINPGGCAKMPAPKGESIGDSLVDSEQGWNYFTHRATTSGRHKSRVSSLFLRLGGCLAQPPCPNAIFLRSRNEHSLPADYLDVWANYCAPVHSLLLQAVQPRVIVCFGIPAWRLLTGTGDPGHWCFDPDVELRGIGAGQRCGVLLYPHFSRDPFRRNLDIHEQAITEARHCAEY